MFEIEKEYDDHGNLIVKVKTNHFTGCIEIYRYNNIGDLIEYRKSDYDYNIDVEYYEKGLLSSRLEKRKGKQEDLRKYFSNSGEMVGFYTEINGKRNGLSRAFDERGNIKAENYYENDQLCIKNLFYYNTDKTEIDSTYTSLFPLVDISIRKAHFPEFDTVAVKFIMPTLKEVNLPNDAMVYYDFTKHLDSIFYPKFSCSLDSENYILFSSNGSNESNYLFGYLEVNGDKNEVFNRKIN